MKRKNGLSLLIILPIVLILFCSYCAKKEETEIAVKYDVPLGSENWPYQRSECFRIDRKSGFALGMGC